MANLRSANTEFKDWFDHCGVYALTAPKGNSDAV